MMNKKMAKKPMTPKMTTPQFGTPEFFAMMKAKSTKPAPVKKTAAPKKKTK